MNNTENEMERIQQGLEQFLYETNKTQNKTQNNTRPKQEPELDIITERKNPRRTVVREAEPPIYDLKAERATAEKELRDAKKIQKERQKIDKMRREAEVIRTSASKPQTTKPANNTGKKSKKKDFDVIEVNNPNAGKSGKGSGDGTKKRKSKGGFVFLISLICLLALVWCYGMTKIYNKMTYKATPDLASQSIKEDGVVNILLIGSDSRDNSDDGRSDAMILMSISNKTHTIQMTSLLRDMYVDIPGHDGNRLNAAYAFGGPELLMKTISQNLDIEVNRYMVVNFEAFANLVDAVGGVKLNLSNDEVNWVNAYLNEYNMLRGMPIDTDYLDTTLSGDISLNGPQALAYSRNRYIGTDFGRTERQRKVLSAVIKKLPKAVITNPKGLVNGLFPNLTTNISRGEFIFLSTMWWKIAYSMEQNTVPADGTYQDANIRGMAVLQVDYPTNIKILKEKIYGE